MRIRRGLIFIMSMPSGDLFLSECFDCEGDTLHFRFSAWSFPDVHDTDHCRSFLHWLNLRSCPVYFMARINKNHINALFHFKSKMRNEADSSTECSDQIGSHLNLRAEGGDFDRAYEVEGRHFVIACIYYLNGPLCRSLNVLMPTTIL